MKLGDIGTFYGGLSGKSKADFKNGNVKYITYMNVYSNLAVDMDIKDFVKVSEGEKQNAVKKGDVFFTGSSETPDECGISSVLLEEPQEPIYLNSFCFGFRFYDKNLILPGFAKYLFCSEQMRKQIIRTASGVTRFNVSKKKMENVRIPVLPLAEQERIVAILDKFDALVNDISQGLPAEIEARKKQYAHYRDRLLDFREKRA